MTEGRTYSVTLVDEDDVDINAATAFVSDRDHKDYDDLIHDSKTFLVVRIQDGDKVVFDRSVCEAHHVKMPEKMAEVVYGMWAPATSADAYCVQKFPHHLDFVLGGCVYMEGDPKTALLFTCPKCVTACQQYKRDQIFVSFKRWLLSPFVRAPE